jgi:hypothetical protein
MPETIACPQCQRKLQLDESVIGQTVQCPSCQNTFVAEKPTQVTPLLSPPPRPADEPPHRIKDDEPLPRRYDADYGRGRRYEDDDDYPRPRRRYYDDYPRAHRGTAIQVLGILSLALFCQPVVAIILAIIAISMAVSDLSAMNRGEMDPAGRGPTKTGLICAIIALVMMPVLLISCIGFSILNDM